MPGAFVGLMAAPETCLTKGQRLLGGKTRENVEEHHEHKNWSAGSGNPPFRN
jgi:hypothetical protein